MTPYETLTVGVSVLTLIPATWFMWSWWLHVPHPFSAAAFDAGGWVGLMGLISLWTILGYSVFGFAQPTPLLHADGALFWRGVGLLVVVARVVRWTRLREHYRHREHDRRAE